MSFVDHVRRLQGHDPGRFLPWHADGWQAGHVELPFAQLLSDFPEVFDVRDTELRLHASLESCEARSEAVSDVVRALHDGGAVRLIGNELYPIAPRFGAEPWLLLERSMLPHFGARAHGVHMNGLVRRDDGLHIWIARRADDRTSYPGQLDNVVGGGQPHGLGVRENLVKESAEEAGFPADLVSTARPVGTVSYRMDLERGLRDDVLFLFDLELPESVVPHNTDGEVAAFELWPATQVMAEVDATSRFKFNCNLVLLDLFLREGLLTPDHPDYIEISTSLRRPTPLPTVTNHSP
ncbi:MAG: DUF4743 domain-containing protein [Planctomycetota bacterium]|nr:MAG: DUF4743 domain-containing protein [Planctomycetota bacterium]